MKVIPLDNQLSNNSSQPTANPRNHEAVHTVLQPSNKWEKRRKRLHHTKPCHIDVTIRWNCAFFKYNSPALNNG